MGVLAAADGASASFLPLSACSRAAAAAAAAACAPGRIARWPFATGPLPLLQPLALVTPPLPLLKAHLRAAELARVFLGEGVDSQGGPRVQRKGAEG